MQLKMPQEIEVWYILPAIRKELAKSLIKDYKLSQRETAKRIGLTEAAVSQYIKEKRGKDIKFNDNILKEIRSSAKVIAEKEELFMHEIQRLCNLNSVKKTICYLHKKENKNLLKKCRACQDA